MWNEYSELENQSVWLADLLFQRYNRTVKYIDNGEFLILAEMVDWSEILTRAALNWKWITIYSISVLLNFVLFMCSISKGHQISYKKLQCLISNFAFCNIVLSLGFLIYTFLVDVYYDVDSFNVLIKLNRELSLSSIWPIAKQIIHNEMVENFSVAQSLILLTLCIDRYLSLFDSYTPHFKYPLLFLLINILIPYLLALVIFDYYILCVEVDQLTANIVRMAILATPSLFSTVFMGCNLARILHKRKLGMNTNNNECLISIALAMIVLAEIIQKFGLFLELLRANFLFEIVVGEEQSDATLRYYLSQYYEVSHTLFFLSPLYSAIFLQFCSSVRNQFCHFLKLLTKPFQCRGKPKLDYSSETMRSIIAEQTRARQMRVMTAYGR